ncbi:hypothetical protein D3C81_676320 [compost metagenome]
MLPPNKSGIKKYPKVGINTNIEPAKIPDLVKGRVTFKNEFLGFAPKSFAASSSDLSNFSIEEYNGNTINGNRVYTIPIITAILVYIIFKGSLII